VPVSHLCTCQAKLVGEAGDCHCRVAPQIVRFSRRGLANRLCGRLPRRAPPRPRAEALARALTRNTLPHERVWNPRALDRRLVDEFRIY
jgi:hypothetical protein